MTSARQKDAQGCVGMRVPRYANDAANRMQAPTLWATDTCGDRDVAVARRVRSDNNVPGAFLRGLGGYARDDRRSEALGRSGRVREEQRRFGELEFEQARRAVAVADEVDARVEQG